MPILGEVSPLLILRLSWIRWSICSLISTRVKVDDRPERALPKTRTPFLQSLHPFTYLPLAHTVIAILNCHSSINVISFHTSVHKNLNTDRCLSLVHSINAAAVSHYITTQKTKPIRCKGGKVHAASNFRVKYPEDGPPKHNATRCHNPEDLDLITVVRISSLEGSYYLRGCIQSFRTESITK